MIYRLIGLGLLGCLLSAGCGEEKKAEEASTADPFAGNWLLVMTKDIPQEGYYDVTTVMLHVQKKNGAYSAEFKGSKPTLPGTPKLKSFEVKNKQVHVVVSAGEYTMDFVGTPAGKTIPGNTDFGRLNIEPAKLVRTSATDIEQAPPTDVPPGTSEYEKFVGSLSEGDADSVSYFDHFPEFVKFCEEHSTSPVSILLYQKLVQIVPRKAASAADVQKFAGSYVKAAGHWGTRMQALARFNLAASLVGEPKFADVGLKYLKEAETALDASSNADRQSIFDSVRRYADQMKVRGEAKAARKMAADGKPQEALTTLRKFGKKYPFDPLLIYYRAETAQAANQTDEALRLYAQLSTWPMLQQQLMREEAWLQGDRELPQSRLLELWIKQHGSEAGLDEFKQKVYAEATTLIAEEIGPPKTSPTGNRVSVLELFTGAQCPPCVGADLATEALEHLYSQSHLIVLRYHVHIPAFDPMTNRENFNRFVALLGPEGQDQMGTPTVFLNGTKPAVGVGGSFNDATRIGKELNEALQPALDDHTPLDLKLTAHQTGGEITVSAKLAGVPKDQADKLRVLLLLAEGDVEYAARNGILRHEMLVRWLYNGEKGSVLNTGGNFDFTTTTRTRDIREFLESTLQQAPDAEEPANGFPLKLEGLYFVGFVHNPETHEILQAASVPVEVLERSDEPPPVTTKPGPTLLPPSSGSKPAQAEKPARQ